MLEIRKEGTVLIKFHGPTTSKGSTDTAQTFNRVVSGAGTEDRAKDYADTVSKLLEPLPALNNRATWDSRQIKGWYESLAKEIDEDEAKIFSKTKYDPDQVDWWIDCGLMASIVARLKGGNCDDLASYALATCVVNFGGFAIGLAQLTKLSHSFVLIQSKENSLWLLDTWVRDDRVIPYKESLWAKHDDGQLVLHIAEVAAPTVDMTRLWYEWLENNQKRTGRSRSKIEYPRADQVGKYTHQSAKSPPLNGLR